uniref:Uncharacterized protein n=1 Tax=Ananas comosus var. bracteatus TaxID=296719 RepID=A0A6V7Q4B9_ANACO|nr:unnamed protein product [Ananas comosus var. bracteatus]
MTSDLRSLRHSIGSSDSADEESDQPSSEDFTIDLVQLDEPNKKWHPKPSKPTRGRRDLHGDASFKTSSVRMLEELDLPKGLFPLEDVEEFGYNRAAGFMWFVQKKKKDHTFKKIKQVVSYGPEVTAFVEKGRLKKITG